MEKKYPALIIIPHGGYIVPEEMIGFAKVNKFDLFYSADSCSNELFSFSDTLVYVVGTKISKLFIDVDRSPLEVPPITEHGVIKRTTPDRKAIFRKTQFPDEIAIANLLRRYYFPFHKTIERVLKDNGIKLILDCHTVMAVGSRDSVDPGEPRPIITVGNNYEDDKGETITTAPNDIAEALLESMKKSFSDEKVTVAERFSLNRPFFKSQIMKNYGPGNVPFLRMSLSRALFFNEKYFNFDYVMVDEIRISQLKEKLWKGLERFFRKVL